MFILTHILHIHGQGQREKFTIADISIFPLRQLLLQVCTDLLGYIRINVGRPQFFRQALNNLCLSSWINIHWISIHNVSYSICQSSRSVGTGQVSSSCNSRVFIYLLLLGRVCPQATQLPRAEWSSNAANNRRSNQGLSALLSC